MTKSKIQKLASNVTAIVERRLREVGFSKRKNVFTLGLNGDVVGWLGINLITSRNDGRVGINPVVGVRSERIEELVGKLCRRSKSKLAPTLSTNLGYVMPQARYIEWLFEAPPFDYALEGTRMVSAIEEYGIPFMSTHFSPESIAQELTRVRFTSKDAAVYRLPVFDILYGNPKSALEYVRQHVVELEDRQDISAQEYRSFARDLALEVQRESGGGLRQL